MNLNNHNAEKVILAGMLRDPDTYCLKARSENINDSHFTDMRCCQIYPLVNRLYDAGSTYLIRDLSMQEESLKIARNDPHYTTDLADITAMHMGEQHWNSYLRPIKQAKARRDAYQSIQTATSALEGDLPVDEVADILRLGSDTTMLALESQTAWKSSAASTEEFVQEFETLMNPDLTPGIKTGLRELDRLTGGMRKGELWVVCGETSAGKSVAALQFAASAIQQGKQTALFSLEMGAGENVARMMSNMHDIHFGSLRNPQEQRFNPKTMKWEKFTTGDKQKIIKAVDQMRNASLRVVDEGGLTIERIEAICREMDEREKLELIVIDYVQLIGTTRKGFATHEELSWLVGRMKQMAKTFSCPVITASQLNDNGQLHSSRGIGHHADVVMRIEGEDGIYMMKNRNGERHIHVPLALNGAFQKFTPTS